MLYSKRVEDVGITIHDYQETLKTKIIGVLTRKVSHNTLDDNPIYKDHFFTKVVYTTHCDLNGSEAFKFE